MTLALIAGTGALPDALLDRLAERPMICALDGFSPNAVPDLTFRLEHLGSFLASLRDRGISKICMAGAVNRPAIDPAEIDEKTRPLVRVLQAAMARGDDGAIRGIVALLEDHGFAVVAAHDLAPDLLPSTGVLTKVQPEDWHHRNAEVGEACIADMGKRDTGQACVVKAGKVALREGSDGTAAMLDQFRRLTCSDPATDPISAVTDFASGLVSDAADWLSGDVDTPLTADQGILFKAPKPDQDRRADLPVIGVETARQASLAGLSGIVIEAGGVMVLDLVAVIDHLNARDMFLWVRAKGEI